MKERRLVHANISVISILLALFVLALPLRAQNGTVNFTIKGVVFDTENNPVETAYIIFNNSISVLSDQDGRFVIQNVKPGAYDYAVSCLGFEEVRGRISVVSGKEQLNIILKQLALALQEVTVTARQTAMGSKSTIGQDAIRHIQPKSVADMLQLLPGSLTANPHLNNLAQATIREIDSDDNNALGTTVILDGAPLSNDGNLQALSPSKSGSRSSSNADGVSEQTTAGKGVDLRTVGADNIESVEVIRGIPSVEYGNLTSGVVIVKTKAGKAPLEVKFKADPFSKLVYAGKGMNLRKGGAVNFGIDWSQSYGDTRKHYLGYERITASIGYSNVFHAGGSHPVSFNMRGSFYSNINNRKTDPQLTELQLKYKNENTGARLSFSGDVKMNNWLTAIGYDVSAQASRSLDTHHNWVSNPDGVITNSRENGLAPAQFLTKAYFSDYKIEGLPVNIYAQIKANKYIQLANDNYTNIKVGVDYRYDDNRGDGLTFDMVNPPQAQGTQTLRPRSFKDIPALHHLSGFVEDNMMLKLGKTSLQIAAGLRVSNLFLDKEKSGRSSIAVAEPRVNLVYTLLDRHNNKVFDNLSISGGYGISHKMPTLLYLYPDMAYFDNVSLSQIGTGPHSSMALMTTRVVSDTKNPDLKPSNSKKWELGVNFRIGKLKGYITYFKERYRNEFGFSSQLILLKYSRFNVPVGATGLEFDGGQVHYIMDGLRQTATVTPSLEKATWARPDNTSRSDKHGIEYAFDLGTFKPLRTSLNIDGAWFHIKRQDEKDYLNYINRNYDYVPLMPAGNGSISERINTNFRLITHIPAVKMVFTTTVQVVWHESVRSIYQNTAGKDLYHLSSDGTRYIVSPLGFYDNEGTYTKWKSEFEDNPDYQLMNGQYLLYAFKADRINPWMLLNFRFTKEFGKVAELSFMANNFANISEWHINKNTRGKKQLYPDMYFGAELKFKL